MGKNNNGPMITSFAKTSSINIHIIHSCIYQMSLKYQICKKKNIKTQHNINNGASQCPSLRHVHQISLATILLLMDPQP